MKQSSLVKIVHAHIFSQSAFNLTILFAVFFLHRWMRYIAWCLVFTTVLPSAFFVILYSMQWGGDKSNEWLTAFILSFFESFALLDPLKVGHYHCS